MCFSSPSIPAAPPPPPTVQPAQLDAVKEAANLDYRRRIAAMAGRKSTQLTGPQGVLSQASPAGPPAKTPGFGG